MPRVVLRAPRCWLRGAMWACIATSCMPASAADVAERGAQTYAARCGGCHSADANRVGPRHGGVIGRRAGSVPGFEYSPALRASNIVWDATTLDRWLSDPESLVPGQQMGYSLADPALRAEVIAYLQTLTHR